MEFDSERLASQVVIELEPLDPSLVAAYALTSNYSQGGHYETDGGEETEGLFSDDTGFYSAVEDLTSQDEEDEDERLEREVDKNYPALLEKYCGLKHKIIGMKDPFNEVDFTELCLVLKMSAEKSGLLKSAELLDIALQIFFRQVSVCHRSVVRLAEGLHKRGGRSDTMEHNGGDTRSNEDEDVGGGQRGVRQRRTLYNKVAEQKGKWVDRELGDYNFEKELADHCVMRRLRMHDCMETIVQNPFLDFEVNFGEFYNLRIGEGEMERDLNQSAAQLIKDMGRFSNMRTMGDLFLPGEELGGNEEEQNMEDLNVNLMEVDSENMEPDTLALSLQSVEEDLLGLSAGENLGVVVMEDGGCGENVPPKDKGKKGSKKNRKRRRVPFGEHQNIEEEGQPVEEKRARLEGEEVGGDGGVGVELDNHLNENPHEQSTFLINEGDLDNLAGDLDITLGAVDNFDGIFRPPSPLSGQDLALIKLNAKNHNYDMTAIKTKFKEIVNSSPPENGGITFVEILEKCEMSIIQQSSQYILPTIHQDNNLSTTTANTKKISVGVAFLAMLHNAASEGFYLKEDPEGAFKVSKEKPAEEDVVD